MGGLVLLWQEDKDWLLPQSSKLDSSPTPVLLTGNATSFGAVIAEHPTPLGDLLFLKCMSEHPKIWSNCFPPCKGLLHPKICSSFLPKMYCIKTEKKNKRWNPYLHCHSHPTPSRAEPNKRHQGSQWHCTEEPSGASNHSSAGTSSTAGLESLLGSQDPGTVFL